MLLCLALNREAVSAEDCENRLQRFPLSAAAVTSLVDEALSYFILYQHGAEAEEGTKLPDWCVLLSLGLLACLLTVD
jgi:hypothetical protein